MFFLFSYLPVCDFTSGQKHRASPSLTDSVGGEQGGRVGGRWVLPDWGSHLQGDGLLAVYWSPWHVLSTATHKTQEKSRTFLSPLLRRLLLWEEEEACIPPRHKYQTQIQLGGKSSNLQTRKCFFLFLTLLACCCSACCIIGLSAIFCHVRNTCVCSISGNILKLATKCFCLFTDSKYGDSGERSELSVPLRCVFPPCRPASAAVHTQNQQTAKRALV